MDRAAMTRRSFVGGAAAAGAALALPRSVDPVVAAVKRRNELLTGGRFSLGVASGLPSQRGTLLWTRVDGVSRNARIGVEVARDANFARVVHRGSARVARERDFTVHAMVDGRGFAPGERYWYRFFTKRHSSPVGRFQTALPPDSREPVRIGFFSCQNVQAGFFTAHAGLADEPDLDLVVCLGDYIYERTAADGPEGRKDTTGRNHDSEVLSLPEYRQKYRFYRRDTDLQAMHAAHPFAAIWDDHEVEDGYAGVNGDDDPNARTGPFVERRRVGYLAHAEYTPRRRRPPELDRIYGTHSLGANADLFLLDTRQYRDDQPCKPDLRPCPQRNIGNRTLLGVPQKQWLKGSLTGSKARWKVIANQVMMASLELPAGYPVNMDQWDGYPQERQELMEHLVAKKIEDVAIITGDIHTFFAANVSTTGKTGGTPAATEFVGGSVTSFGIPENYPELADAFDSGLRGSNPHIKFMDLYRRGYAVLEARPDELRVDFKSPKTTFERTSPVETLASFRVTRGEPAVEQL